MNVVAPLVEIKLASILASIHISGHKPQTDSATLVLITGHSSILAQLFAHQCHSCLKDLLPYH